MELDKSQHTIYVKHYNRLYLVMGIFPNTKEGEDATNNFLERNNNYGVLTTDDNSIYVVDVEDAGWKFSLKP